MIKKTFLLLSSLCFCALCDWVKIPQVSNTPKVTYKVQTVASFSDFPSTSILAHSDVLSSVFSYNLPKIKSTTTEKTKINKLIEKHEGNKYLQSTVTSKSVAFEPEVSDLIDHEDFNFQLIKLQPVKHVEDKVLYMNQTIPKEKLPKHLVTENKSVIRKNDDSLKIDDNVVTESDEEDEKIKISSSKEFISEEIYYEYDEPNITSTTTKAPRKTLPRKIPLRNSLRRKMPTVDKRPKMINSMSFSNFLRFLKNIQDNFTTRTAKNLNEKISMLRDFRDKLLMAINYRIKSLWKTQSKSKENKSRSKRSPPMSGWMEGGSMNFPSAEGALLSISFLTFAVFLIKLVLVN